MRHLIPTLSLLSIFFVTASVAQSPSDLVTTIKRVITTTLIGTSPLVNVTARQEEDESVGVERLTDGNWDELVTQGSEVDVWVVIVHGPKSDAMSRYFLDAQVNATILASEAEGLENVHWARIEYVTEVELCTKWLLFRPPLLLFATDQGRELRWLKPRQIRPDGEQLFKFVQTGRWTDVAVWTSEWRPGGNRAWLVELYLSALSKWTHYTANIPTFVFLLGSSAIGQGVISWLHRSSPHPVTATSAPTPASGSRPISREALRAAARAHGIGKGEERKDR